MTDDDADRFARLLGLLEAAYRVRLSRETVDTYWRGLRAVPWDEVRHAVDRALETCKRLPTIAELRGLVSTGRIEPSRQFRGTYPPDIAQRRRALGLPVTAEEHAGYEHGTWGVWAEPVATREQVEAIYQDVAPRCSPTFAKVLRDLADRIHAARNRQRDPGEEG